MNRGRQLVGKNGRDHPMALKTRASFERRRDDLDVKMRLSFGAGAGMAAMTRRVVDDPQARRRERRCQLSFKNFGHAHSA